jgi:hypothetical protein
MLGHYSHVRREAKRKAVDALAGPVFEEGVEEGYDTSHVTNQVEPDVPISQVVDVFGGADGARTRDLRRDRPAF